MDDSNKVYSPEVITDLPLPVIGQPSIANSNNTQAGQNNQVVNTPQTIASAPLPRPVVAHESIGESLNTKMKKIIGAFSFIKQGAIEIGEYINGVSGDIRISPNGITARNAAGNTTFSLDGDTGNATFAGEILAGDVSVIDDKGLVSLSSFFSDTISGAEFDTTSATYVDVTGITLTTPNFEREVHLIIFGTIFALADKQGAGDFAGEIDTSIAIDGVPSGGGMVMRGQTLTDGATGIVSANSDLTSISGHLFTTVSAGVHTISLKMLARQLGVGNFKAVSQGSRLSYIVLGR